MGGVIDEIEATAVRALFGTGHTSRTTHCPELELEGGPRDQTILAVGFAHAAVKTVIPIGNSIRFIAIRSR